MKKKEAVRDGACERAGTDGEGGGEEFSCSAFAMCFHIFIKTLLRCAEYAKLLQ